MTNDVAKVNPFGAVSMQNRDQMAKRAKESAADGKRGGAPDGSDYMNFSGKRGIYTIGQDKRAIAPDELWLLNITSFEDGWVCWKGGKPVANRMANIFAPNQISPPDMTEMGPFNVDKDRGEGWSKAKGFVCKSLDNDQQGYFKVNSVSGVGEIADFLDEVSGRMAAGEPCWPVFSFTVEEFEAQGYKNFKPIFKIYGWLGDESLAQLDDDDCDLDELIADAAAPGATDSEDTSETAADPQPDPEKPASRRRRRSA